MSRTHRYFAITNPGLEGILSRELRQLGLPLGQNLPGGVEFKGEREELMRANLYSRVANRIIERVEEFHASSFHELERRAKKIDWARYVRDGDSVQFRVTCRKSKLYHSDAVAERLNAVAECAGAKSVADTDDEEDSDAQIFIVRISNDICSISADSSGELLHRRGYRQAIAKAPLRETIAAAMLIGSEWNRKSPLVDPMCGSGTIAIEGALMARNIAPGAARKFQFERWPDHDEARWQSMISEARGAELPASDAKILASDRDAGAVAAATANAERAGVMGDITISERALSDVEFPDESGWIVSNPPYGLRVGESGPLRNLYARLGAILREKAGEYVLALLSADRALDAQLRIDLREVFRTTNGGIPVRLVTGTAE